MPLIRPETAADRAAIRRVHTEAFGGEAEADLVDALRGGPAFIPELSLVAENESGPVGHILFTRVGIFECASANEALALAPMAVLPEFQNRGIGSALVRHGVEEARRLGHAAVVVLGHPKYYPRFGFVPANRYGIRSPFSAPPDAFQALGLVAGALDGMQGLVSYPPEFDAF